MNFKSGVSLGQLNDDYNQLSRTKSKLSKRNILKTSSDNPLDFKSTILDSKLGALSFYDSGLFPVNVDDQFTFLASDDEKVILHGKLEPCRYKMSLERSQNNTNEAVTIHVEALELSLDLEAVMTQREQKWTTEFNLFRKDGDVQRDNLITVLIKVSRSVTGTTSSFGFQLYKKKDVVHSIKLNMKQLKKIPVSNIEAGIYEVVVHPIVTDGLNPLNVKISAYEERSSTSTTTGTAGTFLEGSQDLVALSSRSYLHHEVAQGVAQTSDWVSDRFIIYGRSNMTTPITAHISVSVSLSKPLSQDSYLNEYKVFVYRVGDDTPVMEISQHELGQLCTHLVTRIFYAYNVKKSVKELDDIIAVCDSYGTVQDKSKSQNDQNSISVRPEPMVKVREIAVNKKEQLIDYFRRNKEIKKGIEEKNLTLLLNYMRDKNTFDEALPLTKEAQQVVQEMEAKTKFENEIYGVLQQEALRFAKKHPHYDIQEIFAEQDQTLEKYYKSILKEEKENGGKNCGPMSYVLKTLYESIKLVKDEIMNNHLESSKKDLLTKQVVWRRMAQTSSDEQDRDEWKVKLDNDEDEVFFFEEEYEDSDDDLNFDSDDEKKKKPETPTKKGANPLLGKLFSSLSTKSSSKSNLNLGFIALMGFALYTSDQIVRKEGDSNTMVSKLSQEHFMSIYRVARYVIVYGLRHVKKNSIVQEKLTAAIVDQLTSKIEFTINSLEKYLPKDEVTRMRKIIYAINDRNDARFESLLTKTELAAWKEKKQREERSFTSILQRNLDSPKPSDSSVRKIEDKPLPLPAVAKITKDMSDSDDDSSIDISDSDEDSPREKPKNDTNQTQPIQPPQPQVIEEEAEDEIVVKYDINGIDQIPHLNLTNPEEFIQLFVNQVDLLVFYLENQVKLTGASLESLCDEHNKENLISAYFRKSILPAFRALFIGPFENPGDVFTNEESYNFNYLLDVARSGVQNANITTIIEGIFKVQKEITINDLWLEDPDHFKSTRFNAFWCHLLNTKKALQVFDEICSPNYYSNFYIKKPPKFAHPNVRAAFEKLCQLPLSLSGDAFLNQYDPCVLEEGEETIQEE
ncbi:hypothetical protein FDP41_011035 [Naegleria fowleri]|uniref:Uncharacterized protein n=1 Tax=Naegleria fowleri TaxID=5763 RepID=A0A6A5C0Q4_NAEFO|nr:uncharacterized protein FDP41_011035 [Naegleria fowleri]KAF0983057.1 hypothetical protein FDP41_011035 [Naegleria fowleri]